MSNVDYASTFTELCDTVEVDGNEVTITHGWTEGSTYCLATL